MFRSKCGQQASEGVRYCTRCGEALGRTGLGSGVRQRVVLFAVGMILIPVWMFIGAAFPPNDRLAESLPSSTLPEMFAWIGMWVFFIAAAARIAYAYAIQEEL